MNRLAIIKFSLFNHVEILRNSEKATMLCGWRVDTERAEILEMSFRYDLVNCASCREIIEEIKKELL